MFKTFWQYKPLLIKSLVVLIFFFSASQTAETLPDDDNSFELPEDFQPFLQDTPLYTDNTANGNPNYLVVCTPIMISLPFMLTPPIFP